MIESKVYAYCLQGDVTSAFEYLQSLPNKTKELQELESKFNRRFFSDEPDYCFKTDDSWIQQVLKAYYHYFTAVLTRKSELDAEIQLVQSLQKIVSDCETVNLDDLEEKLAATFKVKGYSFLGGVTPPFRGPYIWKTTDKQEFTVELPHGIQNVTVYFLSDFILLSWAHFATFGEKFAGGWAKEDGLYYVNDRPANKMVDLDSSEFQISYLKHEAQHLNDFALFPKLKAKDLEYRAKLVELIYESHSMRLLEKFYYEMKNDSRLPHPYSSYCLMRRLTQLAFGMEETPELDMWRMVDSAKIRKWALRLYDEHTTQLNNIGDETWGVI